MGPRVIRGHFAIGIDALANSRVLFERKLLFVRHGTQVAPVTNEPPQYTNQYYCMSISNNFGMDAWNPYPTNFTVSNGTFYCCISNFITIQVTNNYGFGFTTNLSHPSNPPGFYMGSFILWPAWLGSASTNGFITFFPTNFTTMLAAYFSEANQRMIFFTNNIISSNGFLPNDMLQSPRTGWPVHDWTLNITNHLVYALFAGAPQRGGVLLDFVNLGPFGSSFNISSNAFLQSQGGVNGNLNNTQTIDYWSQGNATDRAGSPMSIGMLNQVINQNIENGATNLPYIHALNGNPNGTISSWTFGAPYDPAVVVEDLETWVANDPIVHYTIDDLTWPLDPSKPPAAKTPIFLLTPLTNTLGRVSLRYSPWGANDGTRAYGMLLKHPQIYSATNWAFPTNKFPGVGWLGRVHRGTPWQTVYLKADNPSGTAQPVFALTNWTASTWFGSPYSPAGYGFEPTPETYPTNDWALVDLFSTAPNDNAARGLLSVNQTNDAAWAAVFAGVIAPTNATGGRPIDPLSDVQYLMNSSTGINARVSSTIGRFGWAAAIAPATCAMT